MWRHPEDTVCLTKKDAQDTKKASQWLASCHSEWHLAAPSPAQSSRLFFIA